MAIYQKLITLDAYYRSLPGNKVILNDLDYYSMEDINTVNESLMTIYDSNAISTIPSCNCGITTGVFREGDTCTECGSIVSDPFKQTNPLLWLKVLPEMEQFVNPGYWGMIKNMLSDKVDWIRWLTDTSYNPPVKIPIHVINTRDLVGERNYLKFIHNIDKVLQYWLSIAHFKADIHQKKLKILLDMYNDEKDKVFCTYIPIVNKRLFVMENTNMGKFTNLTVSNLIDPIMNWVKNCNKDISDKKMGNLTSSTISKISGLFENYYNNYVSRKPGAFRKHMYGARSHFTFRAVITSITKPHRYDEIHVAWSIGVTAFRPHILNKLVKQRGYTFKRANRLLYRVVNKYDETISEILDELIAEAGPRGIPVVSQRNPSLLAGSAVMTYITEFNKNPKIRVVALSNLIISSMNADFDGDKPHEI